MTGGHEGAGEARRPRGLVDQKNIFGSQVSAIGSQARVIRFGYGYGS